jgi:hypothetical protein
MSSVLRPAGPLPARVYWRRRLVLLLILVLVIAVFWGLLSALGGSPSVGSDPASTSSVSTRHTVSTLGPMRNRGQWLEYPAASSSANDDESSADLKTDDNPGDDTNSDPATEPEPEPLAEPTGDCAPTEVGMSIDVSDTSVGQTTTATLVLTSRATPACTLAITPASLVLRITTGDLVVWSSDDCPDMLPARQVVVRADPATEYRFEWDGKGSVEGCSPAGAPASPGGYWVEAALVGAESHRGYFDVVA